jgi:hypothetical protein
LPKINVPWHEWLIYSIVRNYSSKLDVGVSNSIFKLAIPLISPKGMMNDEKFVGLATSTDHSYNIDDLDNIDDLIEDYLSINEEM